MSIDSSHADQPHGILCSNCGTLSAYRLTQDLRVCVRTLLRPFGAESFPTCTQGFRPGLYSGTASRLGITIRLPFVVRSLRSHSDSYALGFISRPRLGPVHFRSPQGLKARFISR